MRWRHIGLRIEWKSKNIWILHQSRKKTYNVFQSLVCSLSTLFRHDQSEACVLTLDTWYYKLQIFNH